MSGNGANGTFIEAHGGKTAETMPELTRQFDALTPEERTRDADYRAVSAGYFAAMNIPLIRGRLLSESDGPDAPHVALVSQSLARRYWPNEDAIGKQIQFGNMDGDLHLLNVVGVVGDVLDNGLDREARPTVYTNYLQRPAATSEFSIVVREPWRRHWIDCGDATGSARDESRNANQIRNDHADRLRLVRQSPLQHGHARSVRRNGAAPGHGRFVWNHGVRRERTNHGDWHSHGTWRATRRCAAHDFAAELYPCAVGNRCRVWLAPLAQRDCSAVCSTGLARMI